MYTLVIGRAYPEKETGMLGLFESEQATALNRFGNKTTYAFCNTSSIKKMRKFGFFKLISNDVNVYGYHLPIGGVPQKLFSKIKSIYFKKMLLEILKCEGKPDLIHIHFPLLTLTNEIWVLLKELNTPIVVTEHWSKVQTKEIEGFRINLLKKIVDESEEFICVGEPLKESVLELTNTEKKIKVIPNMVSAQFYYQEKENLNKKEYFEFIAVGRLVKDKKIGLVITAFTRAFKNNEKVHLTIVGGGELYNKLRKQIEEAGMSDRITMLGYLTHDQTAQKVRLSDAFVSGSVLETFGVPFIEAMACGKPVIGIENSPLDKYINKDNGVQFKKNDINSLVYALRKVYSCQDTYDGKNISEKAQQFFGQKSVITQLENIYRTLKKEN